MNRTYIASCALFFISSASAIDYTTFKKRGSTVIMAPSAIACILKQAPKASGMVKTPIENLLDSKR